MHHICLSDDFLCFQCLSWYRIPYYWMFLVFLILWFYPYALCYTKYSISKTQQGSPEFPAVLFLVFCHSCLRFLRCPVLSQRCSLPPTDSQRFKSWEDPEVRFRGVSPHGGTRHRWMRPPAWGSCDQGFSSLLGDTDRTGYLAKFCIFINFCILSPSQRESFSSSGSCQGCQEKVGSCQGLLYNRSDTSEVVRRSFLIFIRDNTHDI